MFAENMYLYKWDSFVSQRKISVFYIQIYQSRQQNLERDHTLELECNINGSLHIVLLELR